MFVVTGKSTKIDFKEIYVEDIHFPLKQHHYKDGMPVVSFTSLGLQRADNLFQYPLIAKFSRGRPNMETTRSHIVSK